MACRCVYHRRIICNINNNRANNNNMNIYINICTNISIASSTCKTFICNNNNNNSNVYDNNNSSSNNSNSNTSSPIASHRLRKLQTRTKQHRERHLRLIQPRPNRIQLGQRQKWRLIAMLMRTRQKRMPVTAASESTRARSNSRFIPRAMRTAK